MIIIYFTVFLFIFKFSNGIYPIPTEDQELYFLRLEPTNIEIGNFTLGTQKKCFDDNKLLEVSFEKSVKMDPYNINFFSGDIVKKVLYGYGYHYYIVKEGLLFQSRFIADPEDSKDENVDVIIPVGQPLILKYNSCVFNVFYLHDNITAKYRIYETTGFKEMRKYIKN